MQVSDPDLTHAFPLSRPRPGTNVVTGRDGLSYHIKKLEYFNSQQGIYILSYTNFSSASTFWVWFHKWLDTVEYRALDRWVTSVITKNPSFIADGTQGRWRLGFPPFMTGDNWTTTISWKLKRIEASAHEEDIQSHEKTKSTWSLDMLLCHDTQKWTMTLSQPSVSILFIAYNMQGTISRDNLAGKALLPEPTHCFTIDKDHVTKSDTSLASMQVVLPALGWKERPSRSARTQVSFVEKWAWWLSARTDL